MTDSPAPVADHPVERDAAVTGERRVLLVCRSPELRIYLQKGLNSGELEFFSVSHLDAARDLLTSPDAAAAAFGPVLIEVEDPLPESGLEELSRFCSDYGGLPVVGVAPRPSADLVREAMVVGVRDFITNPFDRDAISQTVKALVPRGQPGSRSEPSASREAAARETRDADPAAGGPSRNGRRGKAVLAPEPFITSNAKMRRVLDVLDRVAPTDSTFLVEGESGTGKELVARRIHGLSRRSGGPFVEVHCGAIPPSLLESQLFGHEKGSFTGAFARQIGLFEIADHGTIFLDEIAEMNVEMQVKLLRVLQERTFRRIGGRQNIHVDVRVVAATNRELKAEVESGRFRADLYYRLNVISLQIPPLRERLEDIPELIGFFTRRFHEEKGLPTKEFPPETVEKLQKMRWVGNVREIENAVERLLLLSPGEQVLPADVDEHLEGIELSSESCFAPTLTLDEVKKTHIASVLQANNGNKMRTARILGINVKTLYNLIQRLDIPT